MASDGRHALATGQASRFSTYLTAARQPRAYTETYLSVPRSGVLAKTTKIDAVRFTGRSGESYDFRIYVWDTKFKSLAGVYVVASRSVDPGQPPRYEPVFVGATTDLSKAFKGHPRAECFEMYYANVVGVMQQNDESRRNAIVADLLTSLEPPCNAADAE